MKYILPILIALLLLQSIASAKDCFPGKDVSYSPSKKYSIIWQEPTNGETHHLFFKTGSKQTNLIDFGRQMCVHWEPKEKYFALTYDVGSNVSEVYIYSPDGPKKLFDLLDVFPERIKKFYAANFHHYIEVISWTKKDLLAKVWGYGDSDPKGVEFRIKCSTRKTNFNCTEERANKGIETDAE